MMQSLSKRKDIVYAVSFFFSFLLFLLGKEVAYGSIFRGNGAA